jgi:hypothetical protein
MTTITGTQFNEKYPNTEFYKVLTKDYKNYDFTYQHGLNVDHIPFNPTGECSSGGLYFTELDKLSYWIEMNSVYIAKVTIPSNASVYVEKDKFKADQFVLDLDNKVLIKDFYMWENEEFCKISVSQADTHNLVFVRNQPDEICKLAVKHDWSALKYVINQTEDICKIAVSNHAYALQYVKVQTDEICKMALSRHGYGLEFVKVQTDELCKLALSKNGRALQYVLLQTDELCTLAVSQNGFALEFVLLQTDELCTLAVSQTAHALKYVINQTDELCTLAVSKNPFALEYVKVQTDELCQLAVSHNDGDTFAFYIPT